MKIYISNFLYLVVSFAILFSSCKAGKHIISKEEANIRFTNEHSKFMEIGNTKIHYRDEGEGFPILLIHGFAASLHTWEKIKPELIANGYRTISFDLPGFGLTDYPIDDERIPKDVYFEYIGLFLQKMQIEKMHVAGNSLGGWVAWELAYQYPNMVDKLVLLDAAGYDIEDTNASAVKMGGKKIFKGFAKSGVNRFIVKQMIKQSYGDKKLVTDEMIDFYYGLANREGNIAFIQHLANNLVEPESERIKEIKNKTLILWGTNDRLIDVKDASKFMKDLDNDQVIIYEGVGHTPMEECPEKCATDMIRFLKEE